MLSINELEIAILGVQEMIFDLAETEAKLEKLIHEDEELLDLEEAFKILEKSQEPTKSSFDQYRIVLLKLERMKSHLLMNN